MSTPTTTPATTASNDTDIAEAKLDKDSRAAAEITQDPVFRICILTKLLAHFQEKRKHAETDRSVRKGGTLKVLNHLATVLSRGTPDEKERIIAVASAGPTAAKQLSIHICSPTLIPSSSTESALSSKSNDDSGPSISTAKANSIEQKHHKFVIPRNSPHDSTAKEDNPPAALPKTQS
ncbi:hypothetical protein C8J56DRAFT_138320 [Mycena floridula]|nr:hypothetical protein C8J56DRAFT_138320 [Mycena floridula]